MNKIFQTFANALCRYESDTIWVWNHEPIIANSYKLGTTCYSEFLKKWFKNVLPTIVTKNAPEDLWNVAKSDISITLHEVFKPHAKYDVWNCVVFCMHYATKVVEFKVMVDRN